jgi:hypothetical protein
VGEDFNPEIGFARRKDFRQSVVSARVSPRPRSIPWIRQITLQADVDYVENARAGFVESRDLGGQFRMEFESSDQVGASFGEKYEYLAQDETISGALVPVGRYSFREVEGFYTFGAGHPAVSSSSSTGRRWIRTCWTAGRSS